ncbi:MAG: Ig-like domain-containing protein [Victivallales bacterium]|nr:Ig-like domain-containing protein [Victivallales bacterium]
MYSLENRVCRIATQDLAAGDLASGALEVTATGKAYGLHAARNLTVGNIASGAMDVTATGTVYGLYAGGTLTAGDYALDLSGDDDIYGFYAGGDVDFAAPTSATLRLKGGENGNVFGVYSANGKYAMADYGGEFALSATGGGNVTLVRAHELAVTDFSGEFEATAESGRATALEGDVGTVSGLSGKLTATGGSAYGLAGFGEQGGNALALAEFTGTVTATASGEAAAVARIYTGGAGNALTLTGLAGTITAESTDGDAFGVLSRANGNGYYQQTYSTLTADGVGGHITVTASGTAAGVYSLAENWYYNSSATSTMSLGDITGEIAVTGGSVAYGLYSRGHSQYSTSASTLTVGDVTGRLSVEATGGDAYGMYSSQDLIVDNISGGIVVKSTSGQAIGLSSGGKFTIAGEISGDVFVSSDEGIASFISGPNAVIGNKTIVVKEAVIDELTGEEISPAETELVTTDISGRLFVNGAQAAYGILTSVDSRISISGIVAAGSFLGTEHPQGFDNMHVAPVLALQAFPGYAYADGTLSGGVFTATASDDDLHIVDGALVIGGIALGGGENILTIDSGALIYGDITADSLSLAFNLNAVTDACVVTADHAGALSDTDTKWTLNIADGLQSGRYLLASAAEGFDADALADVTVTVNASGESHEIAFADRLDKIGFADVNVTEYGEVEFIYSDTFWVIDHSLRDGLVSTETNGSITLRFGGILDAESFSLSMVAMSDADGNGVVVTGYSIDLDRLTLEYEPLTADGAYTLEVSSSIMNVNGRTLDQNLNKVSGEEDDGYRAELMADVSRPFVTEVEPLENPEETEITLRVHFSEAVDPASLEDSVKILAQDDTEVALTSMILTDGSCLELVFPAEAVDGEYRLQIGESIRDLAGNVLDSQSETGFYEWSSMEEVGVPEELVGTSETLSWLPVQHADQYVINYSTDGFGHLLGVTVPTTSLDSYRLPEGIYQWRVQAVGGTEWANGEDIAADAPEPSPQLLQSDGDGDQDLFFAAVHDTWSGNYQVVHAGSLNDWEGTGATAPLAGRNMITDVFRGSADPSLLCLTDDDNGDALFVDDIYSELPGSLDEQQARVAQIGEIRAGAGDDVVDLTSQRFEYIGGGLTIRGGLGSDVIWANKGNNTLFGDAGNDWIVGAGGDDLIVGGAGDDALHGGGGDDVFAFGGEWGNDTVEQCAGGTGLLWLHGVGRDDLSLAADGEGNAVLWCDRGSVTLLGVKAAEVEEAFAGGGDELAGGFTLRFGDDESDLFNGLQTAGAFDEFTSERLFENNKGMLA